MSRPLDWIIPPSALRWGRLTMPPPLEITITVDTSQVSAGLRRAEAAITAVSEFEAAFERVREIMQMTGTEIADMQAKVEAWAAEQRENSNRRSTGP